MKKPITQKPLKSRLTQFHAFSVILSLSQFAREHLRLSRLGIRFRSCQFSANDALRRSAKWRRFELSQIVLPKNPSKNHVLRKFCRLLAFFFYFTNYQALAAPSVEEYRSELQAVESYLNGIKNLSAKFIQESSGGTVEGKFFLSRRKDVSGKMRVEYLAQPKVLIVVNGSILSYQDIELDEISHLSTNTTPASFLTRPNISFSAKDIEITNIKKSDSEIKISLMKKNRKEAGEFSLTFALNPLKFVKMEVKNDVNQAVSVTLSNIDFVTEIPDQFFVIKNKNLP
jgi:outer membrane lipoprotein-sorting protein